MENKTKLKKKDILNDLWIIENHRCFKNLCINNQNNIKILIKELRNCINEKGDEKK